MGQGISAQERDVFELISKLLQQHGKTVLSHDLKVLLRWAAAEIPGIIEFTVFTTDLWDKAGIKLWDAVTKGSKAAAEMMPYWRVIFETLKAHETSQAAENTCSPSTAET